MIFFESYPRKERKKTEPLTVIDSNCVEDSSLPDRIKFVAIVPLLTFAAIEVLFF